MKTAIAMVLVVGGAVLWACAGSGGAPVERATAAELDAPVHGGKAVLTVYGMSCPLCANNVDKVLLDVPGVTGVDVDMGSGRATVSLDSKAPPTRRMLEDAVHKSGFTLQKVEVP
jgi:copper chaperone CopZ